MCTPPAELEIDERLVRSLLDAQCPQLAGGSLERFAEGFDNALWRLGDDLLVRLPRRALAAPLAVHEQRWLPDLAAVLPLPIPAPVVLGVPGCGYPWHWSVVPLLRGHPASIHVPLASSSSSRVLGAFLAALHAPAPRDAPHNVYRAVALHEREGDLRDRLAQVRGVVGAHRLFAVVDRALAAAPFDGPRRWIHGDLHPGNVLVDEGELAGVCDFGDLTAGDPATDLASAWLLFAPPLVDEVFAAYGSSDADLIARSKGWAVFFGAMLATIEDARDSMADAGQQCLERLVDEEAAPRAKRATR